MMVEELNTKIKNWTGYNLHIVKRVKEELRQITPEEEEVKVKKPKKEKIDFNSMTKDELNDFAAKKGYEAVNTSMKKQTMIEKIVAFLKN